MRFPKLFAGALFAAGAAASPLAAQPVCAAGSFQSYFDNYGAGGCQIAGVNLLPLEGSRNSESLFTDFSLTPISRSAVGGIWVGFDITGPFTAFRDEFGIGTGGVSLGISFSVVGSKLGGSSVGPLRDRVIRTTVVGRVFSSVIVSQAFVSPGGASFPRFEGVRAAIVSGTSFEDLIFTRERVSLAEDIFRTETTTDVFYDPNLGDFRWNIQTQATAAVRTGESAVSEASFSGVTMEMFIATVPEPASLALTGVGLFGLLLVRVRKRRA